MRRLRDLRCLGWLLVRDAGLLKLSGNWSRLFWRFCWRSGFVVARRRSEAGARGERFQDREQDRLLGGCTDPDLLRQVAPVLSLALDVGFRTENRQRVVKAVKLHKLSDHLGRKRRLRILSQFAGERVLPVERALALLDLVLVVDSLENTVAQLGAHLAEHTVRLEGLNDKIL